MVDVFDSVNTDSGFVEPRPVTLVSKGAEVRVDTRAATATFSSFASGIASIVLLPANPGRRGGIIINTDANMLFVDFTGGAASSARYGVGLAQNARTDVPAGYTGAITGGWTLGGTGRALVTEFAD